MLGEGKGKELEKVKGGESIPSELDRIMYYCNKAFFFFNFTDNKQLLAQSWQ